MRGFIWLGVLSIFLFFLSIFGEELIGSRENSRAGDRMILSQSSIDTRTTTASMGSGGSSRVIRETAGADANAASTVSAGADANAAGTVSAGQLVLTAPYGNAESQVGVDREGFGTGPAAFFAGINGDEFLLLDQVNDRIARSRFGRVRSLVRLNGRELPRGITTDDEGMLYLLAQERRQYILKKYDLNGSLISERRLDSIPVDSNNYAYLMVRQPNLYIIIGDTTYQLTDDGKTIKHFGVPFASHLEFVDVQKTDEQTYVATIRSATGAPVFSFELDRPQYVSVDSVFVDEANRIYLVFENDPYGSLPTDGSGEAEDTENETEKGESPMLTTHLTVEAFSRDGELLGGVKLPVREEYHSDLKIMINEKGDIYQMEAGRTELRITRHRMF